MAKYLKLLIAIIVVSALGHAVSAQSYSIRVEFNTNIRAQPCLDAVRLETAPAGTILEVLAQYNRWLRVNRGDEAWMAAWVAHERIEGQAGSAGSDINNCCYVDRQCSTDQEWENGYWAFQNGQCQAPTSISQPGAPEPAATSQVNDNCCGIDRQCHSKQEWVDGYWAYQRGQCGASGQSKSSSSNCCDIGWRCTREHEFIYGGWAAQHNRCTAAPNKPPAYNYAIPVSSGHGHIRVVQLSDGFAGVVNNGLELLRTRSPEWYLFAINAITEIREVGCCSSGVHGASGITDYHHAPHSVRPYIPQDDYTMAEFFVHEAAHVYQDREGRGVGGDLSWLNEYEAELYNQDFKRQLNCASANCHLTDAFLNDPMNRDLWWWNP